MATAGFRVTYATLSADDDELHAGFERPRGGAWPAGRAARLGRRRRRAAGRGYVRDGLAGRRIDLGLGKTRLEALGDVEESADLIRYYTHQLALHDGFGGPHYLQQYLREQSRTIVAGRGLM